MTTDNQLTTKTALFEGKEIRRIFVDNEWWFSVIDVIALLTDSENPRNYWNWMKSKDIDADGNELSRIPVQLKLSSSDGKMRETDCANVEGIFRIIQSIPSPKAEQCKRWLAKLGKERIEEMENPGLGVERARLFYEQKGYSKEWIETRVQSISVRKNLTDEWSDRGAQPGPDYATLTNKIMHNAFGINVNDYKKHKGLKREELRDHMSELEIIITMLGEATTTKITKERDSQGMPELKRDAAEGGAVAGRARKDIEVQTGKPVISQNNFLPNKKKKQIEPL